MLAAALATAILGQVKVGDNIYGAIVNVRTPILYDVGPYDYDKEMIPKPRWRVRVIGLVSAKPKTWAFEQGRQFARAMSGPWDEKGQVRPGQTRLRDMRSFTFTVEAIDSDGTLAVAAWYMHAEPSTCFQFSYSDYDFAEDLLKYGWAKMDDSVPSKNKNWAYYQHRAIAAGLGMWRHSPTVVVPGG
jgi:hypothetical protein